MELRTLRYFVTVAQELNITRAAEALNMSQPPLSHQIQQLEQELDVTLFLRGKRRLQLTEEGQLLLRRAREILELSDKTRSELLQMRTGMSGTLYLGLVEGRAPYLAARWIAGFQEEFPLVRYSLWNGSSDDVVERLYKGLSDAAVIATPYDTEHLAGFPVGGEPWSALFSRSSPLARWEGESIPLSALVGQPLIIPSRKSRIQAIRQWFGEIGAEPYILCEMSNYVDALALSEQGVGVSIFPQTTLAPSELVLSRVITQPSRQAEYVLVWDKNHQPFGLTQAFIQYVQDYLEEHGLDMGNGH